MTNYCLELIRIKNSDEFKKEKKKIIYDYLLKKIFKKVDFKITDNHIRKTFIILDKIYFNNRISNFFTNNTKSRISFYASSKLSKTGGYCKWRYYLDEYGNFDYGIYEIQISKKIIDVLFKDKKTTALKINGITCYDKLECYINLCQHEITHLLISIFCIKDGEGMGGHTTMFKDIVYNLFGHTEYKHLLLHGDSIKMEEELQFNKLNLEIGDIIESKEIKKTIYIGEVTGISNKYAKILLLNTDNKGKYFNLSYNYINKINKKIKRTLIKVNKLTPEEIKKKLKINDIVYVNLKGKIMEGVIVNIGPNRATVKFDCKKWYIPYNMITIK